MITNNASNTSNGISIDPIAPTPGAPRVAVMPPPANANIPAPPAGFTPVKGGFARGVRPRKAEVVAVPDAVDELRRFGDWQATLGKAAPDQATMVAAFNAAAAWSVMRAATRAWGQYASNEEGMAWTGARSLMAIVSPLLKAAVAADPSLATAYPKLCALFGAKSSIAKKGVSSRTSNKKSDAAGKPAHHGAVGKKRQQAAAKAALAEKEAAATAPKPSTTTTPVSGNNGVAHA